MIEYDPTDRGSLRAVVWEMLGRLRSIGGAAAGLQAELARARAAQQGSTTAPPRLQAAAASAPVPVPEPEKPGRAGEAAEAERAGRPPRGLSQVGGG